MNRVIPFLAVLIVAGQVFSAPSFGIRGGLNAANASFEPDDNYHPDSKAGVILGVSFEASVSSRNNICLRIEGCVVEKGWQDEGTFAGERVFGSVDVTEFVITPAVIFRLAPDKLIPYILVGADVGLGSSAKGTFRSGGLEISGTIDDWADTNVGLDLGAGLYFPSGKGEILTEIRFNIGMVDMYKGDENLDVMTNGVHFLLGYNFVMPS